MQAFSGGLPDQVGETTITNVTPIYGDANNPDTITDYDIITSTVQAPAVVEARYSVDDAATGAISQ